MVVEIPDEVSIPTPIKLESNTPFMYAIWGIRYQFSPTGKWRTAEMVFSRKSDAEVWMKKHYLNMPDVVAEVVPVKRTLLMDNQGNVKRLTEELTEK